MQTTRLFDITNSWLARLLFFGKFFKYFFSFFNQIKPQPWSKLKIHWTDFKSWIIWTQYFWHLTRQKIWLKMQKSYPVFGRTCYPYRWIKTTKWGNIYIVRFRNHFHKINLNPNKNVPMVNQNFDDMVFYVGVLFFHFLAFLLVKYELQFLLAIYVFVYFTTTIRECSKIGITTQKCCFKFGLI